MPWHKAYKKIAPYVLKVETPEGSGTGFFFAFNNDRTLVAVATALHVVEHAHDWQQPIKLTQVHSRKQLFLPVSHRVVLPDYQRDSAAIILGAANTAPLTLPSEALPLLASDKFKKVGVELGWVGYPALAPSDLCFFHGFVSSYVQDKNSYFIDGVAINGVSGGPVFDQYEDGAPSNIIGLVSAYHANRQPGATLPGLLRAQDVTHLHALIATLKTVDDALAAQEAAQKGKEQAPTPTAPPEPPAPEPPPKGS
jgi:hypothetical protein